MRRSLLREPEQPDPVGGLTPHCKAAGFELFPQGESTRNNHVAAGVSRPEFMDELAKRLP